MTNELRQEIDLLKAQVAALTDERLPKVDRASKRRDRRQVLGGFGMFVIALLMAGSLSASALAGSNTVTSDDIVDNGIYHTDIRDSTLTGTDVKNDSLTGSDINESSLNVASGLTSFGSGGDPRTPWPSPTAFASNDAIVSLAKPGNLLVMASAPHLSVTCTNVSGCQDVRVGLYVDGVPVPNSAISLSMADGAQKHYEASPTFFGVMPNTSAGNHHVRLGIKSSFGLVGLTATHLHVMGVS